MGEWADEGMGAQADILDRKRFEASVVAVVKAGSIDYLLLTIDYFS